MKISLTIPKAPENQAGFLTKIFPGEYKQAGPNTFEVYYKIPENQASGEYKLDEISVVIGQEAPITLSYSSPADFPTKTFKVENPKSIMKPTIKNIREL